MSTLGGRITKLRTERKWTQSELARLSGISQSNINLIESGTRSDIKYDTIIGIARAFRISTDELMGYDKDAIPEPVLAADDRQRIDELEKGLVRVNERLDLGFQEVLNRLDARPLPASTKRPKQSQRKRS